MSCFQFCLVMISTFPRYFQSYMIVHVIMHVDQIKAQKLGHDSVQIFVIFWSNETVKKNWKNKTKQ